MAKAVARRPNTANPERTETTEARPSSAHSVGPVSAPAGSAGKPVVFDTNALLLGLEAKTPFDDDLDALLGANHWIVPSTVLVELKTLAYKGKGAVGRTAKLALAFAAKRCRTEESKLPGDDGLLDVARRLKGAVVTNDKALQQECKRSGLTVVVLREDGQRLALLGAASGRF